MSAQEIQESLLAQEALEQEQRGANAQVQQQPQRSTQQNSLLPQFSSQDPGEMTVEETELLFALQAEQQAEEALTRSQMTGSQLTSAAMAMEAEAGGPQPRTNAQGTQTNQQRPNTLSNANFDPALYEIADQAFQDYGELSVVNSIASQGVPRVGGNLFGFNLNNVSGGQGNNLNPALNNNDLSSQGNFMFPTYQTDQTSGQSSEQTLGRPRRGAAAQGEARRRGNRMSDEAVVDYLLGLGVPVGDDNGLYPIADLRELAKLMLGEDV